MGSIAPVIGLSLADARIARRAALLVDALQLRCALDLLDALPGGSAPMLILTDRIDGGSIAKLVRDYPGVPVLAMGGDGSQDAAIEAIRAGAADYLWSARCDSEIVARIARHIGCPAMHGAIAGLDPADHGWVGGSIEARRVRDIVARVARSNTTILIEGETGTGKDVIALALHRQSRRADSPIVPINCAAIPEALIEGELFGYARGAFTGASQAYPGKFREADGGTLFLDEIGELSASAQAKLLRAIETREVSPLGSPKRVPLDVRIVAATNRDLARQVADGRFRSDLYYRLAVVRIALPPLRERRADVAPIAHALLDRICSENGLARPAIDATFIAHLACGDWLGNVRELRNALEHAAITARDPARLSIDDLPELAARPVLRRRGDDPQDERGAEGGGGTDAQLLPNDLVSAAGTRGDRRYDDRDLRPRCVTRTVTHVTPATYHTGHAPVQRDESVGLTGWHRTCDRRSCMTDRRTPGATDPTDDRDVARQYVNRIDLDISLSEIRIDLGQAFPGEPMPRPQCRLVTSPSHLHTFESAIVSGIRTYESRFGTVLTDVADGALAHG